MQEGRTEMIVDLQEMCAVRGSEFSLNADC